MAYFTTSHRLPSFYQYICWSWNIQAATALAIILNIFVTKCCQLEGVSRQQSCLRFVSLNATIILLFILKENGSKFFPDALRFLLAVRILLLAYGKKQCLHREVDSMKPSVIFTPLLEWYSKSFCSVVLVWESATARNVTLSLVTILYCGRLVYAMTRRATETNGWFWQLQATLTFFYCLF